MFIPCASPKKSKELPLLTFLGEEAKGICPGYHPYFYMDFLDVLFVFLCTSVNKIATIQRLGVLTIISSKNLLE